MHKVEQERAQAVNDGLGLNQQAFEAAWEAFQNTPIRWGDDADEEECRAVGNAIKAYLARADEQRAAEPRR